MLRFKRGEIDLINSLDSEYFDKLAATSPQLVHDAGPSLDSEQMWFNEVAKAPLPRLQEEMVPLGKFPARNFPGDQSRRPGAASSIADTRSQPWVQFLRQTSSGSTPS